MISTVIITYHEDEKLEKCLMSIEDFADEIVIVDLAPEESTHQLAKKFKAKYYTHEFSSYVEPVRNFAISKATGKWILILDPDETVNVALKDELKKVVKSDEFNAINIPRKNIFFGKWIAHTNFWPDRHIRFLKKEQWIGQHEFTLIQK